MIASVSSGESSEIWLSLELISNVITRQELVQILGLDDSEEMHERNLEKGCWGFESTRQSFGKVDDLWQEILTKLAGRSTFFEMLRMKDKEIELILAYKGYIYDRDTQVEIGPFTLSSIGSCGLTLVDDVYHLDGDE